MVVEVAYADPNRQILRAVTVPIDTTLIEAVAASGVLTEISELSGTSFVPDGYGIFGQHAIPEQKLREGDRVEIYRPLLIDPKDARRQRSKKQKQLLRKLASES